MSDTSSLTPPQPPPFPPYIEQSLAKAQRAIEISQDLFRLCLRHATSDDPKILVRAGSLLGDFANNLRSALNYTTAAIVEHELLPRLRARERKALKRNMDFPWANSPTEFKSRQIAKSSRKGLPGLYKLLHRLQPFNPGFEWLGHLMTLSNRDKHIVINTVEAPTASNFLVVLPDGSQRREPWFVGDKLVILTNDGPVAAALPHYYDPLKAFAAPRKTWSLYIVPMRERFSLDLVDFTRTTPPKVVWILQALQGILDNLSQARTR